MCSKIVDNSHLENTAIHVENVSKCFNIYESSRDRLMQMFSRKRKLYREFWALRDVNFSIYKGETIGIIGRNGSGKSTLLQIICGTLNATTGNVTTNGRIAALLELGSGFNPEFTGAENVYLNGSILGLSREEMSSRYNEIISFADIGDFINQPVKNYSSGMQVRLAFSVAIHVNPEILVVDEALSVGDAYFQAKCARAISRIIESGTTVLFVSHDISSVKALCSRAILLESGHISFIGDVNTAIEKYYCGLVSETAVDTPKNLDLANDKLSRAQERDKINTLNESYCDGEIEFQKNSSFQRISQGGYADFINIQMLNSSHQRVEMFDYGDTVTLRQIIRIKKDIPKLSLAYHIRDKNGLDIIYSDTYIEDNHELTDLTPGDTYVAEWKFKLNLKDGNYVISSMASIPGNVSIGDVQVLDFIPISYTFTVSKGKSLPIYAMVYWSNELSIRKV
ncbi:ABC transporter ATP-binding protein [Aeromonas sobria]|uniref:ABC transporter ATP-binding protein n=1 Tax=Aeromonas sobria TaxID=646 RepID=UPI000C6D28CA|nr:ABC transporter ATP-binding protein [Aeromonas sobria]PKQ74561.1 ABC transporter ATP-binding protein [Aeromonas sobria]